MAQVLIDTLNSGTTSYTVPSGVLGIYVECYGAGGNTEAASGWGISGAGGGGWTKHSVYRPVTPGQVISCQIPSGGQPSTQTTFGSPGDTWYCAANSGANGVSTGGQQTANGGAGGAIITSITNTSRAAGSNGSQATAYYVGGAGGNSGNFGSGGGAGGAGGNNGPGGNGSPPGGGAGGGGYSGAGRTGGGGRIYIYQETSVVTTDLGDMFAMF